MAQCHGSILLFFFVSSDVHDVVGLRLLSYVHIREPLELLDCGFLVLPSSCYMTLASYYVKYGARRF